MFQPPSAFQTYKENKSAETQLYTHGKDVSVEPPSYLVFFKGRDVDVMTAAFKEFSAKTVKQKEQPSIRHKLDQEKAQGKAQHKEKVKVKTKDRGVEL